MRDPIPFASINARATAVAAQLCQRWLPTGHRSGQWWLARCPWREDKTPSLGVSLTTGNWKDFAMGDHGDWVDLFMRLYGGDKANAAESIAIIVGHEWRRQRRAG